MQRAFLFVALLIGLSVPVTAEEQSVTLAVDKMFCAMCPITVTKAMKKVDGVSSVQVDYETKTAVVIFDDTNLTRRSNDDTEVSSSENSRPRLTSLSTDWGELCVCSGQP